LNAKKVGESKGSTVVNQKNSNDSDNRNRVSIGMMRITFYAGDGITANGTKPIPYQTCAAGLGIPIGTKIYVPSIGTLIVTDRGNPSVVTDNVLDVFVDGTESETNNLGVRNEECFILK